MIAMDVLIAICGGYWLLYRSRRSFWCLWHLVMLMDLCRSVQLPSNLSTYNWTIRNHTWKITRMCIC